MRGICLYATWLTSVEVEILATVASSMLFRIRRFCSRMSLSSVSSELTVVRILASFTVIPVSTN